MAFQQCKTSTLVQTFQELLRWGAASAVVSVALGGCGGGDGANMSADAQAQRNQTAAIAQTQQSISALMSAVVQPGSGSENFEAGMGDWQNWGNAQVAARAGSSGSNALQVGPGAGGAGLQVPGIVGGTTYRLTAQVKATHPAEGSATLGVAFYDASGAQIVSTGAPHMTNTDFAPFTHDVVAPANAASALVWIWKNGETGFAYLDDVAFAAATTAPPPPPPPASNLLSNGGFEAGMTDWVDWGNTHIVDTPVNSGAAALSVGPAAGGAGHKVDGIVPSRSYRLVARAKVSEASETLFVGVNFLDQAGSAVGTTLLSTTSTSYTTLSGDITAPTGAERAQVFVWKNGGSGLGYVDDFAFGVASFSTPQPGVEVSPNLIVNSLFQQGLAGWVNWGNTTIGGLLLAQKPQVGTAAGGFGQTVSGIIPGETYRLSAGGNVSIAGETGYLGLKFLDAAGNALQDQLAPISSTEFGGARMDLVAPANATSALVYFWKNAGSGFLLVSGVSLLKLGVSTLPPVAQLSRSAPERLDADGLLSHVSQSIAQLVNGNYVVAWLGISGDSRQVCFQPLDPNLTRLGPNACVPGVQSPLGPTKVLARPDGGFVILWNLRTGTSSSGAAVFAERSQAFDAAGKPVGGIQDGPQQPVPSTAVALAGGGYVTVSAAVLNNPPPGVSNLSFQRYSAEGTPIGSPTPVGDAGALPIFRVVPLAGGGFAVAWLTGGSIPKVFTRMFNADGTPGGEPVLAGGDPLFCDSPTFACTFQDLRGLTAMEDGGYLVIWRNGFGVGGGTQGVFARRFQAEGTPGAAVAKLSNVDLLGAGTAAPAGPEGFVLVSNENIGTDGGSQIVIRRFDASPLH